MKTSTKLGIVVAGAVGVLVCSGVLLLPSVTAKIEERGLASLKRRSIDLSYQSSNWRSDNASLENVIVKWEKKGIECQFDSIAIDVGLIDAIAGSPTLDHVALKGGSCELDRSKITKTTGQTAAAEVDGKAGTLVRSLLANPPTVDVRNLELVTKSVTLNVETLTVLDDKIAVVGSAAVLGYATDFVGEGILDNENGTVETTIRKKSDGPLLEISKGEHLSLAVQQATVSASYRNRTGTVALENISARYHTSLVEFEEVRLSPDPTPTVAATGGDITISLSDLKALRGEKKGVETDDPNLSSAPRLDIRNLLRRANLVGTDIDLHLKRDDTKLTVFENLEGTFNDDQANVKGTAAEGKFSATAQFDRKRWIPLIAEARLRNVELSSIPGLDSERSQLPNRGTSGAIGGKLNGTVSWRRSVSLASPGELVFAGFWDQGELDLDGLSHDPIKEISMRWVGSASIDQHFRSIRLNSTLSSRGVDIALNGEVRDWPIDPKLSLVAAAETLKCQALVNGLPPGILGGYRNAKFAGSATPKIKFDLPLNRPTKLVFDVKGYEKCEVKSLNALPSVRPEFKVAGSDATIKPNDVMWLDKPFIIPVSEGVKDGAKIYVGPGTKMYLSLANLPTHAGAAAFLSEQTGFYDGLAINFGLVQRALRRNLDEGRFVYGGSTVTQQLVKNLFLTRDKTIARKIQEMIVAWRINQVISKDRILELYINCIEYGPNVYGIASASRYYFQKSGMKLEPKESIFLAMLKPAPWQGPGFVRRGEAPTYPWWVDRIDVLFKRLVDFEYLTEEQAVDQQSYELRWEAGNYKPTRSIVPVDPENQVEENDVE